MARQNKRGLELSFKRCGDGTRGRWYTRIGGAPKYFGWGNGVTDRASYDAAIASFRAWQAEQTANAVAAARSIEPQQLRQAGMSWRQFDEATQTYARQLAETHKTARRAGTVASVNGQRLKALASRISAIRRQRMSRTSTVRLPTFSIAIPTSGWLRCTSTAKWSIRRRLIRRLPTFKGCTG